MAVIGGRNVGTNDLVVMGVGVLAFIDSFLPWWGVDYKGLGGGSVSAWNAGFGAWFSVLLMMVVAASIAGRVFAGRNTGAVGTSTVSWNLVNVAVPAIAAIIILLRWVTYPGAHGGGVDAGARVGTYIGLILAIVQTVFAYLAMVASGERLPWQQRRV
jgi:hypothetical protein